MTLQLSNKCHLRHQYILHHHQPIPQTLHKDRRAANLGLSSLLLCQLLLLWY
ncbi:hypothetical protein ACFX13_037728 [Malus domestica]